MVKVCNKFVKGWEILFLLDGGFWVNKYDENVCLKELEKENLFFLLSGFVEIFLLKNMFFSVMCLKIY